MCSVCFKPNFMNRESCRRCGQPKPIADAGAGMFSAFGRPSPPTPPSPRPKLYDWPSPSAATAAGQSSTASATAVPAASGSATPREGPPGPVLPAGSVWAAPTPPANVKSSPDSQPKQEPSTSPDEPVLSTTPKKQLERLKATFAQAQAGHASGKLITGIKEEIAAVEALADANKPPGQRLDAARAAARRAAEKLDRAEGTLAAARQMRDEAAVDYNQKVHAVEALEEATGPTTAASAAQQLIGDVQDLLGALENSRVVDSMTGRPPEPLLQRMRSLQAVVDPLDSGRLTKGGKGGSKEALEGHGRCSPGDNDDEASDAAEAEDIGSDGIPDIDEGSEQGVSGRSRCQQTLAEPVSIGLTEKPAEPTGGAVDALVTAAAEAAKADAQKARLERLHQLAEETKDDEAFGARMREQLARSAPY